MLESAFLMLSDIIPWWATHCTENREVSLNQETWQKKSGASDGEVRGLVKLNPQGTKGWLESQCGIRDNNVVLPKWFFENNGISDGDEISVQFRTSRMVTSLVSRH